VIISNWTPAMEAQLADLVPSGKSARQVAIELETTRSAVIGKARRMGLVWANAGVGGWDRRTKVAGVRQPKRRPERTASPPVKRTPRPAAPLVPDTRPLRCEEVVGPGVHIVDLESHQCRWVQGEPSALTYCGQPRWHEGTAYCERHHNVSIYRHPNMALAGVLERERINISRMGRLVRSTCSIEFNPVQDAVS
jgi:hypothetical protein